MTPQYPAPATGRRDTNPVMGDTMGIHPSTISVPPWTVLGYRADGRPIRPIAGGAETDSEPDVDIEVDPEPEAEPEGPELEVEDKPKPKPPAKKDDPEPGGDDYAPPSKAEWARIQAALKKANDDAKRHRLRNRELEDQGRANETEHEKALRLAREEGEKRFREPLVKTAARGALIEAGALSFIAEEKDPESREAKEKGDSRLTRLLKLLDTDGLDIDEQGSVTGLEAAVDDLRRDYPELFAAPKKRVTVRPTGAPRPAAEVKPKTTAEIHAARILGKH
jgi:hypothetical protein